MKVSRRNALKIAGLFAAAKVGKLLGEAGGIEPHVRTLPVTADGSPKRSESGVGALIAWADKLWAVTYLSEPNAGSGTGLYEIDENFAIRKRPVHD